VAEYRPGPPRRGNRSGRREQPDRLGAGLEQHARARPAGGPVVSTSSTSRTRPETPSAANTPRIASRRAAAPRRACGPGSPRRRTSGTAGTPSRGATARASARAWSYPRAASRSRDSGTHVTALGVQATSAHAWAIALPSASATARHPPNFSRWIERRIGPSNPNGARAMAIASGGHSRHSATGRAAGAPHRSHHGVDSTTSSDRHASQNGHGPEPQPAHRLGNSTSSSGASTRGRYPAPPTRDATAGGCRPTLPNPCRDP
jgi:hypothetical protein